jgi:gp16 family phage-associated protein
MTAARVSPVKHDVREMDEARRKARLAFSERGESLSGWSVSRGFNPNLVHAVLDGKLPCQRGQAHKIAVELGLKPEALAA